MKYNRKEELLETLLEWTDMNKDAAQRVTWAIVELIDQMIDESKKQGER